jgi:hypothetical protein
VAVGIMTPQSLSGLTQTDQNRLRNALFICVAAVYGVAIAALPWPVVIGLLVVPCVLAVSLIRPEVGWLLVAAMVFEVVPSGLQPTVHLGAGSIKAYDMLMAVLAASMVLKLCWQHPRNIAWPKLMNAPLFYLLFALTVSVCYVLGFRHNSQWISESRVQLLWLMLPMAVIGVDSPLRHRRLITGVIGFGIAISIYVVVESFLGLRIMTDARIEPLDIDRNADVTRSFAGGGIYLIIFTLILLVNGLIHGRIARLFALPTLVLLALGLAVQYGRGIWIAAAAGLLLSAFLYRGLLAAVATSLVSALAVAALLTGLSIEKPRIAEAMIERVGGIFEEVDRGASLRWRFVENRDALHQIAQHPLLGVGIGGDYKAMDTHSFDDEMHYVHNGYLYFPLKLGLWAGAIPGAFILTFGWMVRRVLLRATPGSPERLYAASLAGAAFVPVLTCFTQPEWADPKALMAIVVLFTLLLLLRRDGLPTHAPFVGPR